MCISTADAEQQYYSCEVLFVSAWYISKYTLLLTLVWSLTLERNIFYNDDGKKEFESCVKYKWKQNAIICNI